MPPKRTPPNYPEWKDLATLYNRMADVKYDLRDMLQEPMSDEVRNSLREVDEAMGLLRRKVERILDEHPIRERKNA